MTMTETAGKEEGAPVRHKPDFYASENKRRWAVDLFKHGYGYTKVASILELSPYTVRDWNREYRAGPDGQYCREYLMQDPILTEALLAYLDDGHASDWLRSQKYTLDFIDYCLRLL